MIEMQTQAAPQPVPSSYRMEDVMDTTERVKKFREEGRCWGKVVTGIWGPRCLQTCKDAPTFLVGEDRVPYCKPCADSYAVMYPPNAKLKRRKFKASIGGSKPQEDK